MAEFSPARAASGGAAATAVPEPDIAESGEAADDHLRHIVCVVCYPAFRGAEWAPHDAVCICGKLLRKGDRPGGADAPECILCNELRDHHYATLHPQE